MDCGEVLRDLAVQRKRMRGGNRLADFVWRRSKSSEFERCTQFAFRFTLDGERRTLDACSATLGGERAGLDGERRTLDDGRPRLGG